MVVTARKQRLYDFEVRTAPMDHMSATELWALELRRLESLGAPTGRDEAVRSKFTLNGGAVGVWYNEVPADPAHVTLEGMRASGGQSLWLKGTTTAGRESGVESAARTVLDTFDTSSTDGFCLEDGVVRVAPSRGESVHLSLTSRRDPRMTIEVDTRTVLQPDRVTFVDLTEERELVASVGGALDVRLDRMRSVAGLYGKELRVAMKLPTGSPELRYTWHYEGEPESAKAPRIDVVGRAAVSDQKRLDAAWEQVLASLRSMFAEGFGNDGARPTRN